MSSKVFFLIEGALRLKCLHELYKLMCSRIVKITFKYVRHGEFPGSPVVRIPRFHCRGHRFDPWSGNQDPECRAA